MKPTFAHSYAWTPPSAIARMECEPLPGGGYKARLVAREGAQANFAALPGMLRAQGFSSAYADVWQERNVLTVPNVKSPEALASALATAAFVSGAAQHETTPVKRQKQAFDTLKWSGRVGVLGQLMLTVNGWLQKDRHKMHSGLASALHLLIVARYGNGKDRLDFDGMLKGMGEYFDEQDIKLPPPELQERKSTALGSLDRLIGKHPLEIGHAIGITGAVKLVQSGVKDLRESGGKQGFYSTAAGLSTLSGDLAIMFVPERRKSKAERAQKKDESLKGWIAGLPRTWGRLLRSPGKIPGALWEFVQDAPLRFMGLVNLAESALMLGSAVTEPGKINKWEKEHPAAITAIEAEAETLRTKKMATSKLNSPTERRWDWLKEQHERLTSQLEIANDPFRRRWIPITMLAAAIGLIVSNALAAVSSKNRSAEAARGDSAYERLYALSARMVAQTPEEKREDVLKRMANYLSAQMETRDGEITSDKLESEIRNRLPLLLKSPWLAAQAPAAELTQAEPEAAPAPEKKEAAAAAQEKSHAAAVAARAAAPAAFSPAFA